MVKTCLSAVCLKASLHSYVSTALTDGCVPRVVMSAGHEQDEALKRSGRVVFELRVFGHCSIQT